jgi:nitrite reductase (NADH) large subunit
MFYIRTADRLQRTSVWLENLEGGLNYLKEVVIEDKLGVCEELELDMQNNIDQYQCEWKTTIESPEKLKRFNHFINSDERDEGLKFITMRDQRFPVQDIDKSKDKSTAENTIEIVEAN